MEPMEPTTAIPATGQDPSAGTPAAATPGTVEATPQAPAIDWKARYESLQPEFTRKSQALAAAEKERDALRSAPAPDEDDESPTPAKPARRPSESNQEWQKRALAAEWQIAQSVYGEDVITAYSAAQELLTRATTPADFVTAFEAFHQARSKAATPQAAPATPAPVAAPVVDSNRQDAPASAELGQVVREAVEKRDLLGGVKALLGQR
jgi:hypothetical protein